MKTKNQKAGVTGSIYLMSFISLLLVGCATIDIKSLPPNPKLTFPNPTKYQLSAQNFMETTKYLGAEEREEFVLKYLRRGYMPNFLRHLKPITITSTSASGRHVATFWVTPDYLAIGNNSDWVRIPMTPITAQKIADQFSFHLPTQKLVDEIYKQAGKKVEPLPMQPGALMHSIEYIKSHNSSIQRQIGTNSVDFLLAGHKKDIVLTNQLLLRPKRVAIYGWHKLDGRAIQPLSLVHGDSYLDYSHGVRLVYNTVVVDGIALPLAEVMTDPKLSGLVSYEGVLANTRLGTEGKRF